MVKLLDSTLREGEQTPGVQFTIEEKVEIATLLDSFGVDYIEAGHPAVSEDTLQGVQAVTRQGLRAEIVAHSRAMKSDVDLALKSDADWVGIFFSVADARLEEHFRKNVDEAIALITETVAYAKAHGLKVRYTPEDTVRSDLSKVIRVACAAVEAGADRIGVADTTGHMDPFTMHDFVSRLVMALEDHRADLHSRGIDRAHGRSAVGIHCHDDLGLAVANSLAAVRAGAAVVDVTVNGLGERTGIAPLAETAVALRLKFGLGERWRLDLLPRLSETVARHSGIPVGAQMPIVGANAFSHNAGLHVAAVLNNPKHYESIPVELVGRERRLVVDKMAGRPTVRARLGDLGLPAEDVIVDAVLALVKERSVRDASDAELARLHAEAVARTPAPPIPAREV